MDWLFERPSPDIANHWLALGSFVLFAILMVAAGVLSTRPGLPPFNGRFTRGFVSRSCMIVGWISGIGVFFGLVRLLQIDPITLGRPIWILLCWIALIAAVGWIISQASSDRQVRSARAAQSRQPAKSQRKSK